MGTEWQAVTSTPRHSQHQLMHATDHQIDPNCIQSLFASRTSLCDIPSTIIEQSFDISTPLDENDNQSPSTDQSPLANAVAHIMSKKRRSSTRRRKSLNRQLHLSKARREQRNNAYSRFRKLEEVRKSSVGRRLSKCSSSDVVTTPPIYFTANDVDFQLAQVDIDETALTSTIVVDMNRNFENFITDKKSQHPYDAAEYPTQKRNQSTSSSIASKEHSMDNETVAMSGQSMNSTTASNQRTGVLLNSHKIPHVVRYESKTRRSKDLQSTPDDNINTINIPVMVNPFCFSMTSILFVFYTCFVCILAIVLYRYFSYFNE